jgi:dTDP-glucose pyrophosphorylase
MKSLGTYFLLANQSIRDAIALIDAGAAKIGLVVDESDRLLGIVGDGDVRRGLLRGECLESAVASVMNTSFKWLPINADGPHIYEFMRHHNLFQVPMLDVEGRVVGLRLLEEFIQAPARLNAVVLMAGGKGERLRPLTDNCPKPMLKIGNKPMLEIILEGCIASGFNNFFISVNYLKDQIIDHFGDGAKWGVNINYLIEEQALGTGGSLGLLPPISDSSLLIINGDVLTKVDFEGLIQFHNQENAALTIGIREHITQIPYGVVQISDSRVQSIEEKPLIRSFINAGIYVLRPDLLEMLTPNNYCDMPDLAKKVIQMGGLVNGFPIHEYWLDIGHKDTFERAHDEW